MTARAGTWGQVPPGGPTGQHGRASVGWCDFNPGPQSGGCQIKATEDMERPRSLVCEEASVVERSPAPTPAAAARGAVLRSTAAGPDVTVDTLLNAWPDSCPSYAASRAPSAQPCRNPPRRSSSRAEGSSQARSWRPALGELHLFGRKIRMDPVLILPAPGCVAHGCDVSLHWWHGLWLWDQVASAL